MYGKLFLLKKRLPTGWEGTAHIRHWASQACLLHAWGWKKCEGGIGQSNARCVFLSLGLRRYAHTQKNSQSFDWLHLTYCYVGYD